MVRNPLKKSKEQDKVEVPETSEPSIKPDVQVVERSINLTLINDKINYLIGLIQKIAEACEIDLAKE